VINFSQFFEEIYVPNYLSDADSRTVAAYRKSVRKLIKVCGDPTIHEINLYGREFTKKLSENGIKPETIAKHCRKLNEIFIALCPKNKNKNTENLLSYIPHFQPPPKKPKSESEQLSNITVEIAPAFVFRSKNEVIQFYLKERDRAKHSTTFAKTSSGTILTIVNSDYEEIPNNNINNKSG
jgi:hypothetical protein